MLANSLVRSEQAAEASVEATRRRRRGQDPLDPTAKLLGATSNAWGAGLVLRFRVMHENWYPPRHFLMSDGSTPLRMLG